MFYQPMDKKIKTWTLSFPAKENPNMEKALLNWPIVLQYDIKAISRKFFVHERRRHRRTQCELMWFVSIERQFM